MTLQEAGPLVVVGLLVDRPAVRLGEDEVLLLPLGAGQHPFAVLDGLVPVQFGHEGHRQRERALAAAGCRARYPGLPLSPMPTTLRMILQ